MSSASSARLPVHKIRVACECGKKYRVPVAKAGKKITCKGCGEKLRVPRETAVSDRSRGNILAELGIDPVAAGEAYSAELSRRKTEKKTKAYHCTRCQGEILSTELKGAYVKGELVCVGCRATDEVEDRRKAEQEATGEGPKKRALVEASTATADPRHAALVASGYGALFFVGTAGPLYFVFGVSGLVACAVGAVVAAAGGFGVFRTRV